MRRGFLIRKGQLGNPGPLLAEIEEMPAAGQWQVLIDAVGSTDTALVAVSVVEFSDARAEVALAKQGLRPNEAQVLTVTLTNSGTPILEASVTGTVTRPDMVQEPIGLVDDGTGLDLLAGDGVYTAGVAQNQLVGAYSVSLEAEGVYGAGLSLNRSVAAAYFVEDRPDLEVTSITLTPNSVTLEDSVRVDATITNLSTTAQAESVRVRFREESSGLSFGEIVLPQVTPGATANLSGTWPVRFSAPEYSLGLRVDVLGEPSDNEVGNNQAYATLRVPVDAPPGLADGAPLPRRLTLRVWPNPFNPTVTMDFAVPSAGLVELVIFDIRGRRIAALVNQRLPVGRYRQVWRGRTSAGAPVAAGIYLARLVAAGEVRSQKLVLVK